MIDSRCFDNGHIKNEAFVLLEDEKLSPEVRASIAQHLAECNLCSENYSDFLTEDELIEIPTGLNEAIFNKTLSNRVKKSSNNVTIMQVFKLATAAVLAISLYSTGVFNLFYNATDKFSSNFTYTDEFIHKGNSNFSKTINEGFSQFSKKINILNGVESYEKK